MPAPTPRWPTIAERAARVFADLGCEVVEVDQVLEADPVDLWTSEFYAGVGVRLKKQLTEQRELLDPAVADMLKDALAQSSEAYYSQVFRRYELRDKLRQFFEQFDLLLTPTLPSCGVRRRPEHAAAIARPQYRGLGLLHLSLQPDRPAGRLHSRRLDPCRLAGGLATGGAQPPGDRHLPRSGGVGSQPALASAPTAGLRRLTTLRPICVTWLLEPLALI